MRTRWDGTMGTIWTLRDTTMGTRWDRTIWTLRDNNGSKMR
jgi:hypothetical protein